MNNLSIRGLICIVIVLLTTIPALSQDCNSTYNNALTSLNRNTASSVREAINLFQSAKRCYTVNRNQEGVQNCNKQIEICNQRLKRGFSTKPKIVTTQISSGVEAAGNTFIFPIDTKSTWQFSGDNEWCKAKKENNTLRLEVAPNPTTESRTCSITVKWSGRKQIIDIIQEGIEATLSVNINELSFLSDDTEKQINVESNIKWKVAYNEEESWFSVRQEDDKLYIKPSINEDYENRVDTIKVVADSLFQNIIIAQEAKKPQVVEEKITQEAEKKITQEVTPPPTTSTNKEVSSLENDESSVNYSTLGTSNTKTTTTVVKQKKIKTESGKLMIQFMLGYHKSGSSYGGMLGWAKKHGFYLKYLSNFNTIEPTKYECDNSGQINGYNAVYDNSKTVSSVTSFTAGYTVRLAKPLYLYLGGGYGSRTLAWSLSNTEELVTNTELSSKGVAADLGLILNLGVFSFSAGLNTIGFNYNNINLGVGFAF